MPVSFDLWEASVAGVIEVAEHVHAPPREWWQRWAERRAAWWTARPVLARRVARVRAIGLWVALAWVVGLWVFWPDLRSGLLVYVGALWVVVAWFFLARTKTLTWSGYLRFYAGCIAWSYLLGVVLAVLAAVAAGRGGGGIAAGVAIAGIAEETLKLLPVVVVAVLAPRRVARFAAVDWVRLGLAAGTAFLVVEESARRVGRGQPGVGDRSGVLGPGAGAAGVDAVRVVSGADSVGQRLRCVRWSRGHDGDRCGSDRFERGGLAAHPHPHHEPCQAGQ